MNNYNFVVSFAGIGLKLETFSSFTPRPSLPSFVTGDRKQFQRLSIVLSNKTGPLFWNSIDAIKQTFK